MKIAMFTDSYYPSKNGVATSVWGTVHELKKFGHEVFVVAPKQAGGKSGKYLLRLSSFRVFKEPETWLALPLPNLVFARAALLPVDLIHSHAGGPVLIIGCVIAKIRRIPLVITYHTLWKHYTHYFPSFGYVKPWMLIKLTLFFGNASQGMIAPTEKVKNELLRYGIKVPIFVVPSGIELDRFQNISKGFLDKQIPENKRDFQRLLYVGRLEKEKSVDFLLRVFARILESEKNVILMLVGEGRDESILKKLSATLGIEKNVLFLSNFEYNAMPSVYADADIFVFDSKTETQGLVILEALASGLPVVVLDDLAFKGEVIDGENGIVVYKKDIDIFAKSVAKLLGDQKLRIKMGENAKTVAKKFSIENVTIQLERAYLKILGIND